MAWFRRRGVNCCLWPKVYPALRYEAESKDLITLQPHVADQAYMPHMRAMNVLFHMLYGGLICCKRLQSDRPKC